MEQVKKCIDFLRVVDIGVNFSKGPQQRTASVLLLRPANLQFVGTEEEDVINTQFALAALQLVGPHD